MSLRNCKLKIRYYHIPVGMAEIQNTNNTKYSGGYGAAGTLIDCWWELKMVQQL